MAKQILLNTRLFLAGANLTASTNKVEVEGEREVKDATTYGSAGWKEFLAGLGSANIDAEGFWEAGDLGFVDDAAFAQLGGAGPVTVAPNDATDGALAYFANALECEYAAFVGKIGEVNGFKAESKSVWPLVRGVIVNPPGTARTATGTGVSQQLTSVAAGQFLYASLHVVSVAGTTPSATFRIESDDSAGFASPTTRITFNAATARGGQVARVAGPIADNFYRVGFTITGTSPSFLAAVAVGIA